MTFVVLQSVVCDQVRESLGFFPLRLDVAVSGSPSRLCCGRRPPSLSLRVHPLVRFASSPESNELSPACRLSAPGSFPEVPALLAASTAGVHSRRHPKPTPFRPRRFARPRRLSPPSALRVCFTPQPRPGFALQGLSLSHSRPRFRSARALLSFPQRSCQRLLASSSSLRTPSGLSLRARVRRWPRLFKPPPARSPLELPPPSGLSPHTVSDDFASLSALGLSWPSACYRCVAWLALAGLPPRSRFLTCRLNFLSRWQRGPTTLSFPC
jgi:hypothetical protein